MILYTPINKQRNNKTLKNSAIACTCTVIVVLYYFRFLKKYMLLGAIWYSAKKPYMNTYLQPIIQEIINDLYKWYHNYSTSYVY